ncbi:MAG: 3-deoxy-manno-octulosonate cytidylyltransferase [Halioglobus sp.]
MSYTVVIPSRYGSSRLPGKPLLDIGGKPMVQHVWERASQSQADRVVVATDDERIEGVVRAFGAEVIMTSPEHPSGTDRLQEVSGKLGLPDDHIVVNVQGDEPLIPAEVIDQVARNLAANTQAGIATLCEPILTRSDLENPNIVKVVNSALGLALYFSRAPIPWPREAFSTPGDGMPAEGHWHRHIGIYAYRCGFLDEFVSWQPAPQEALEQLEQLRAMHHGVAIHVDQCCRPVPAGVDTQADLDAVRALVAGQGAQA